MEVAFFIGTTAYVESGRTETAAQLSGFFGSVFKRSNPTRSMVRYPLSAPFPFASAHTRFPVLRITAPLQ